MWVRTSADWIVIAFALAPPALILWRGYRSVTGALRYSSRAAEGTHRLGLVISAAVIALGGMFAANGELPMAGIVWLVSGLVYSVTLALIWIVSGFTGKP